jgi:hypothetical protein
MARPIEGWVRVFLAGLLVALLAGCGKSRAEPNASDTPTPFAVTWLEGFGSTEIEFPFRISVGNAEHITVVGASSGSVDWGQGLLTPENGYAPFVVALNGAGEAVFSAMPRVSNNQLQVAVAADGAGGSVVVGTFGGFFSGETLDWGELQLVAPTSGSLASYVVRLGADGASVWGRAFAAGSPLFGQSVALDFDGNVLWAGNGAHDTDFGSGPQSGDAFLVKLGPTGQVIWSKVFNKSAAESIVAALGVAVDSVGSATVLGTFSSPVDFGTGSLVPAEGGDVFVAKFDAKGSLLWNRGAGGWRGGAVEGGIAVGPDDEIAVAAPFGDAATFGAPRERDLGSGIVLVARLEADGTPSFIRRAGAVGGAGVAIDGEGRIVVVGSGVPEGAPKPSTDSESSFVLEYDSNGRLIHYLSLTGDTAYSSVAAVEQGSVFVTGGFGDEVTAGDLTSHGAGAFDCYVGRLEP